MKITITPQAVSWKNRHVKVAGQWASVDDKINLLQIRVGQEHEVEVVNDLEGNKVIERIYKIL